ncbi:MAG: DNA repair protein RadC [Myxococcota bacterium]|nr:DNA repair protein RadC [Myxococcota bacterium]
MSTITDWPTRERPRERLREYGVSALSDAELLALVLGSGNGRVHVLEVARQLLRTLGGLEGIRNKGIGAMSKMPGLGAAKGARLLAALELGIRVVEQKGKRANEGRFHSSADIYEIYRARLGHLKQEVFMVVGLNAKNELLKERVVAKGSVDECHVAPPEVFRPLIAEAATRAILIHNHPSGDSTPSPHDVALTRRLIRAGELLGIQILDHVIIGTCAYASLRDLGVFLN